MNIALTLTSADFEPFTLAQMTHLFSPGIEVRCAYMEEQPQDAAFGSKTFNGVCWRKAEMIRDTLGGMAEGAWLFYLDADVLLFAGAGEIIASAQVIAGRDGCDLVAQNDPDTGVCAGFMCIKNTEQMRTVFRALCQNRHADYNDQIVLNAILRYGGGVPHAFFPHDVVSSYGHRNAGIYQGSQLNVSPLTLAYHLNYCVGLKKKQGLALAVLAARGRQN